MADINETSEAVDDEEKNVSQEEANEEIGNLMDCETSRKMVADLQRKLKDFEPSSNLSTRELTISSQDDAEEKRINHRLLVLSLGDGLVKQIAQGVGHPVDSDDDSIEIPGLKGINSTLDTLNEGLKYWLDITKDIHYQDVPASKLTTFSGQNSPKYPASKAPPKSSPSRGHSDTVSAQQSKASPKKSNAAEQSISAQQSKSFPQSLMKAVDKFHPDKPEEIEMGFLCMLVQDTELLGMAGDEDTGNGELVPATTVIEVAAIERVNGRQYAKIVNPVNGWIPCHDKAGIPNLPAAVRAAGKNAFISLGTNPNDMEATIRVSRMDASKESHNPRKSVVRFV